MTDYDALCARLRSGEVLMTDVLGQEFRILDVRSEAADAIAALVARVAELEATGAASVAGSSRPSSPE